ncbi:peptide deformylase [Azospirillum picis]|uniref:Peptide deformylase n=1 Tax=Azospirillum picis TaxID=488438 RepID=A0ABU0MKN1_9PROT|nr:peptide deformylase [Azospirillum picis]MBP2300212.1 peptide deformylase [Azospirillum picis]MDQ0533946.1 peptide deformylase [Azospirillum picis]
MARLPILVAPHPVLKRKAQPVAEVDACVAKLMDDMVETMYDAKGIGLAAPQVGVLDRVIVIDVHEKDEPANPIRMANPEIVWSSEEKAICEEGCLSIPEQYAEVTRPKQVRVRYLDEKNQTQEMEADGLLATCIQHEIDHLNGVLFVDYLSMLKRNMLLKKVQKLQKATA